MRHLILLIFVLIIGCTNPAKETHNFSGNWYTCSKDGLYIELIIKADSLRNSCNNGVITNYCNFRIDKDTLTFWDSNIYEDSIIMKKALITFISENQMILDYFDLSEKWTFYKLKEEITDIDNNEILKTGTQKRALKYNCKDVRTIDEKVKDSLERQIDFSF